MTNVVDYPDPLFMLRRIFLFNFSLLFSSLVLAQHIEPENGVHDPHNTIYVLQNARLVISPDLTLPIGTLVVQDGIILSAGIDFVAPSTAVKIDMSGYTIYPSFIELYSSAGVANPVYSSTGWGPQLETLKEGPFYWNQSVHPETNAYELYKDAEFKDKKDFLEQGFGTIAVHQGDGIMRGTSALLTLSSNPTVDNVIQAEAANHFSFSKGSSNQTYPSSQMGIIALLRQFYYDAKWYAALTDPNKDNVSLQQGLANFSLPQIFGVADKLEILRAAKLAKEFNISLIVKGGGDEFEMVSDIKNSGTQLIIPVNFPDPYDMTDPYLSRFVSLRQLKEWEMRPYNAYILFKNKIPFAFTTDGLKKKNQFLTNVSVAVKHGLPEDEALRALTVNPAKYLRMENKLGTLEKGKFANFLVVKGDIFNGGEIFENWTHGDRIRLKDINQPDYRGEYSLTISGIVYDLKISGKHASPTAEIIAYKFVKDSKTGSTTIDTLRVKPEFKVSDMQLSMMFELHDDKIDGIVQLNGSYYPKLGIMEGTGTLPSGAWITWAANRSEKFKEKDKAEKVQVDTSGVKNVRYPNMAFGFDTLPKQRPYYIKNATLWTNEAEGIVRNGNLIIEDGKIKSVNGTASVPSGAVVIDATGKHVTCGIIDEHSHIAISKGVNEGGQSIASEVSIADVVRNDDINIYRQLAGGVTAAQLLHGSANPIGGQSALIKLKWGFAPEEMLIDSTDGFIKFALGENVKQSNWGDQSVVRYPQTRMGVEQIFYSAFISAKEYKAAWEKYYNSSERQQGKMDPPRRDLELEALCEILDKKRFITCHSYVQSEINMLMHVADSMGFTVNTFTHILEGYKVADKMKEHGAGASTFADWWAYKYEVNEAIPYNAALLDQMGIVTAINSDDAEMGRRLNQEAAKAVKYGGISEESAWKMVTLNPAKLLHLDDRMGSLKAGKDADIVIWSDNPLSVNAKVEQTFIEGILFYDVNRNYKLKLRDEEDRKRITGLMLVAKAGGAETQKPAMRKHILYHCDTIGEEDTHEELE
ncbi:MAG: amidohydrolase family protein [Crocinitomicaceae bacterium]|nr:amidohydrolase family protein [Crocinitomicaceae bacterium]